MDRPYVFAIGFDTCGGHLLAGAFEKLGHTVVRGTHEPIAEDILVSRALRQRPFRDWPEARVFVDLWGAHQPTYPLLEGFRAYKWLHAQFPDAIFLLNTRELDVWLAARRVTRSGSVIRGHQRATLLGGDALLAHWAEDWQAYHAEVRTHFGASPQLIELPMGGGWRQVLVDRLGDSFGFSEADGQNTATEPRLAAPPKVTAPLEPRLATMAEGIAAHAIGQSEPVAESETSQPSPKWSRWDGQGSVRRWDRSLLPITPLSQDPRDGFLPLGKVDQTVSRALGLLNSLAPHLRPGLPVVSDMQDARNYGRSRPNPAETTFVYNRMPEARNCVLWPLGAYHTPFAPPYVTQEPKDEIPFADKDDCCVWRGNLTGGAVAELLQEGIKPRGSGWLLQRTKDGVPDAERATFEAQLNALSRYHLTARLWGREGFDFRLVLSDRWRGTKRDPAMGQLVGPAKPVKWFYRSKYFVSLSGHDTGSNFLMGVNSNALVFKEDEDWELFYSKLYAPWEHYVPIARGGTDLEEKLDWARSHPKEAEGITRAARAVSSDLARLPVRRRFLRLIAEEALQLGG